jgi:uncharacterized protein (TIGR02594 family)
MIPTTYQWLSKEPGPKMLLEAIKLLGIKEIKGAKDNKTIVDWADEVGIGGIVNNDEQAWCGLAMAIVATRAGKSVPMQSWDILRALEWIKFGDKVNIPMLGDILIFKRKGGGHVGMYVGEDRAAYHVIGGNQGDAFSIVRIGKDRLFEARRPKYNVMPSNVRRVHLSSVGGLSVNEA